MGFADGDIGNSERSLGGEKPQWCSGVSELSKGGGDDVQTSHHKRGKKSLPRPDRREKKAPSFTNVQKKEKRTLRFGGEEKSARGTV